MATARGGEMVTTERMGAATGFRWLAPVIAVLIVAQAFLIGQGWFLATPGLVALHGHAGNATFLLALGLVGLAWFGRRAGALASTDLGLSLVLVLLLVAQLGLGYSGRESAAAAAWHIPNGVLLTIVVGALTARALAGTGRVAPAA